MVSCKKIMIRLLFLAEVVLFVGNFLYAENGLSAIVALHHENSSLANEIETLKELLVVMEEQLLQWNRYPYYKEKVAREQLQMVRNDEIIYFNV